MALNDSTRARFAVKALLSLGAATAALAVYAQTKQWATAAFRTWALATLTTMFMSAMVTAQAPGELRSHSGSTAQIRTVADAFARAVVAGDARAVAAMFAPDGYELPPGQPAVKGRPSIEQRYRAFFNSRVKVAAFTISPIASSIEGDVAYDVGTYLQRLSLPDGKTIDDVGKYIVILKRTQGEWKIAYSTYNGDSSTAPMPCSGH
jgi:uncharacterized protein (TIGR02246 family)